MITDSIASISLHHARVECSQVERMPISGWSRPPKGPGRLLRAMVLMVEVLGWLLVIFSTGLHLW